jgi:hypothetical protein
VSWTQVGTGVAHKGRRAQVAPGKARPWVVRATGRHRVPVVQKQCDEMERMG